MEKGKGFGVERGGGGKWARVEGWRGRGGRMRMERGKRGRMEKRTGQRDGEAGWVGWGCLACPMKTSERWKGQEAEGLGEGGAPCMS